DQPIQFMLPNGLKEIINYPSWLHSSEKENKFPAFHLAEFQQQTDQHPVLNFLFLQDTELGEAIPTLQGRRDVVVVLSSDNRHNLPALRRAFVALIQAEIDLPVITSVAYPDQEDDKTMLFAATDVGGLLIDGLGEGIMLSLRDKQAIERPDLLA